MPDREGSRLLLLDRENGALAHHRFRDLPDLLETGDVLVVNDTRVVPARLLGKKATGGNVEVLILDYGGGNGRNGSSADKKPVHRCLIRASKRPRTGTILLFDEGLEAEVLDFAEGLYTVAFSSPNASFSDLLHRIGRIPLPPYIGRTPAESRRGSARAEEDAAAYQTVYAEKEGAVAAPTAGLHFTPGLLDRIREKGVEIASITLHVGYGTFVPVRVEDIRSHQMHSERFEISPSTAETVSRAKADGRRVIAVGTTCVRTLEYAADETGRIAAGFGNCDLFIYPGYRFKAVDRMITNFHLPESTLLMLVSAFAGREKILNAYRQAVEAEYRFYSYGDAMFIR